MDHSQITEEDASSQFLVNRADVGKNRATCSLERTQLLNPMVEVKVDTESVSDKSDDYFTQFDIVCATCCKPTDLIRINNICAQNAVKFFAGDVFGFYGYMFSDLGVHEYAEEVPKPKAKPTTEQDNGEPAAKKSKTEEEHETVTVKKSMAFKRLKEALEMDWTTPDAVKKLKKTPNTYFIMKVLLKFMDKNERRPATTSREGDMEQLSTLRKQLLEDLKLKDDLLNEDFAENCFAELSPVCAIVGGVLGQEIIKAVSQKDAPHNNFFFYNGTDGGGLVDNIG